MKKKLILIPFLFLFLIIRSQTISIGYYFTDSQYTLEDTITVKGRLIHSNNKSLYTNHLKKIEEGTSYITEKNTVSGNLISDEDIYYKDFIEKSIFCESHVSYFKNALLRDSLNIFNWELLEGHRTILGYKCKIAKTDFRGRNYTAYYTTEIPITDGPWKFNGLPGVILEVTEENNRIHYEAVEVKIENKETPITSPFNLKDAMYWHEIIEKAKKKFRATKNEIESKFNSKTTVTFNGIEMYDLNE